MGKSLPTTTTGFKNFARIIASDKIKPPPKQIKLNPNNNNNINNINNINKAINSWGRLDPDEFRRRIDNKSAGIRVPLSATVSDCVKRWFSDTLKEAKNGDISMQVLVGQMYNSGYGVRKNTDKGHAWITRASRARSSVWGVGDKQPGYNASDSDSEDLKDVRS